MHNSHASNGLSADNDEKQIGVQNLDNHDIRPRHRPLTPVRALRGLLCLVILIYSAFMIQVYWAPITAVMLRFFSIHYSRKATTILFGAWLGLWPFLFEKINKTKVIFAGDCVSGKEHVLVFANHRTEVDWMYLWNLALRKNCLGYIKYVLKSSLMKIPIFGWSFHIVEFIPVSRKWEIDEPVMRKMLSALEDPRDPLWLAVFPEGTDYTEQKCIRSQKYAMDNGLPVLKNVLLPKTKGFCTCLEVLRNSLDEVYDVTIAYKHRYPTFMDNVFGVDPAEVHIHIQRILLHQIPSSEDDVANWLIERFRVKDKLLTDFSVHGHFPREGTEGELPMSKCFWNIAMITVLSGICTYFTFFCSGWFKIYVILSSVYLTSATFFNIRPSPILSCIKTLIGKGRSRASTM